ncbi:hypothetical protein PoB_001233500 [Plakobranchus ocellatus]|uniref:Uncharacterized protein n=1 Tax=Plakobranchus ocellatus TaxID=259542 RepID=A0AAV3YSR4_9GAST|nr:hypothetical protein PoB_001233500 [Plakobranchus ocellatus]
MTKDTDKAFSIPSASPIIQANYLGHSPGRQHRYTVIHLHSGVDPLALADNTDVLSFIYILVLTLPALAGSTDVLSLIYILVLIL